jgi:hypothetical protein
MSPKTTIPKVSKTPELLLNIANFRFGLIGYARLAVIGLNRWWF